MANDDFRQAIETIKLRTPIEELVRERVPGLRRAGRLWHACCPFHEEKTPSFKVDPRRGTWHCYGACATGGDQISFLERSDGLQFMEALEVLAARSGVELPRTAQGASKEEREPLYDVLERAVSFFRRKLREADGRPALDSLLERGLTEETIEAFGLGWAPASGQALVGAVRRVGIDLSTLEETGLSRRSDQGRPYDFFRGRWTIPIRDLHGRTVGFGARRMGDGPDRGPKYVNSSETKLFHKGRLVYGLDLAIREARRSSHLILVEGYTDVMAAHQVGLINVVAVLGTSTTEDHAGLLRRAAPRRISLIFDGDAAGRAAALRALHGLLPLDAEIDVVGLPAGADPCDVLLSEGKEAFEQRLAEASPWLEYVGDGLKGLSGAELSSAVDGVLELFARITKPVYRESCMARLAEGLNMPTDTLRAQYEGLPGRRRSRMRAEAEAEAVAEPVIEMDAGLRRAFESLVGAVLLDNSLLPMLAGEDVRCQDPDLAHVIRTLIDLDEEEVELIDESALLSALVDHPSRNRVPRIAMQAAIAESSKLYFEENKDHIEKFFRRLELARNAQLARELDRREGLIDTPNVGGEADPQFWAQLHRQMCKGLLEEQSN